MRRLFAVILTFVAVFGAGWLSLRRPDIPFDTLETAYATPQSQYFVLGEGRKVHYRDQGNPDGDVLVMVHGFAASLHTWQPWVRELESTYRIITIDLPGHGLTRGFDLEQIDIDGFIWVVDQLTEALEIDRFTLVGSSMGGHTAWSYAVEHGEKLDGLVLVGAAGWPNSPEEDESGALVFRLLEFPVARSILKDLDVTAMIRSGLEDSFVDDEFVSEDMVQRYAALNRAPGHRAAILHISGTTEDRPMANAQVLAGLSMPVLVIHGRSDNLVPVRHGDEFARAIPDARLLIYEDAGHLPHEEVAVRSAGDLRAFLNDRVHRAAVAAEGPTGETIGAD
ncbi:MAG: alpha/beta hydrolase [Pseudomonadota bacterium]